MILYRIAATPEKIARVTIDRTGMITMMTRRNAEGSMHTVSVTDLNRQHGGADIDFIAQVARGHSGTVEILSAASGTARTLVPLGADHPFLESELPPSPGASGAYSQSEAVKFRFTAPILTWSTENMSGRVELTARVPEVSVTLRLPTGNEGAISFPDHASTTW